MLNTQHQPPYSRRPANGDHRMSPTPSEQSFQTTVTNPASLFSVSQADAVSDSISLATTAGGDSMIWERRPRTVMPVGYTMVRAQPPGFLNFCAPGNPYQHQQQSDIDLFEFLKNAQLEHYYTALTTHLKIRSVQQIKYVEDSDLAELGFSRPEQRRLRKYFKRECPQTTMGKLRKRLSRSTMGRVSSSSSSWKSRDQPGDFDASPFHTSSPRTPTADEESRGLRGGWAEDRTTRASGRFGLTVTDHGEDSSNGTVTGKKPVYQMIASNQLEIGTSLGEGEFGRVYQGVWRPDSGGVVQVAVKVLDSHGLIDNPSDFLSEIAVMHRIRHPDIVHLYGVCVEPDSWKIVTELAPLRSLVECLREPELRPSFPVTVLHRFAMQIARGMSYLEEIGLVHRDLAARNILVFSKEMVKISDFGMSRALHLGKSYYQSNFNVNLKLPTAWCAPECIHDLCFTSASDVWAYAVTLWEMYTYGFTPWAGLTGRQILETIDAPRSGRLDQPDACPDPMYDAVMRACWAHEPKARPSFSQLLGLLPRLCPEKWVTTREYHPQPELKDESNLQKSQEQLPYLRSTGTRSLGRHLSVGANELVYVLGKRSSQSWKVMSHYSGQVGCVPTNILKPYSPNARESRDSPASQAVVNQAGGEPPAANKELQRNSRRASLSDLAFRKTVSRLTKLTGSGNHNGGSHSATPNLRGSRLTADKISLPQNDFRHVGHVGSDGRTFGDLGLVGTAVGSGDESHGSQTSVGSDASDPSVGPIGPAKPSSGPETRTSKSGDRSTVNGPIENSVQSTATNSTAASRHSRESPKPVSNVGNFITDTNKSTANHGRVNGDPLASKTIDTVDEGMGIDFGASLLDEVFKCFSLDSALPTTNETKTTEDTHMTTRADETDSLPIRNGASNMHDSGRISPKLISDTQPEITFKPKYLDLTSDYRKESFEDVTGIGHTSPTVHRTGTINPSHFRSFRTHRDPDPAPVTRMMVSEDSGADRRSRALSREPTSDEQEGDSKSAGTGLRSRWKRSSFGSLSRRSISVSKLSSGDRRSDHRMRDDSEPPSDRLRSSSRLTISPPMLISKPVFADSSTLSRLPSSSSSTLTSLGTNAVDRGSLRSSISRESSLTMVSSSNGYPYPGGASAGEGLDEHMFDTRQVNMNGSSISPAPSLSSISQRLKGPGIGCGPSGVTGVGSATGGLRALRGGDVVFRAATHTTGGALSTRRKISGPIASEASRPTISRPITRDFAPTFGTTRSPDYLSGSGGSASILSRLDGLSSGGSHTGAGGGLGRVGTDQKGSTRRFSTASSSSSSSSSSPLSPPSLMNSPVRVAGTDSTRNSSRLNGTNHQSAQAPSRSGTGGTATKQLDLDGQIASFWGSTFADLLNGSTYAGSGNSDASSVGTTLSDLHMTNTSTKLVLSQNMKTSSSSHPSGLTEDDEVFAM